MARRWRRYNSANPQAFGACPRHQGGRPRHRRSGEFCVFVGPSGCGKSTLLRLVAGLEDVTDGDLLDRRPAGQRPAAGQARHRHGVPILRALSAHDGRREHGVRAAAAEDDKARHRSGGRQGRRHAADRATARPPARSSSPAASGSASPSAAPSCASRRSSCSTSRCPTSTPRCGSQMRLEIAKLHHDLQRDHDLRHPRPGRGDDPGRPDRACCATASSSRSARRSSSTTARQLSSSPASSARRR